MWLLWETNVDQGAIITSEESTQAVNGWKQAIAHVLCTVINRVDRWQHKEELPTAKSMPVVQWRENFYEAG